MSRGLGKIERAVVDQITEHGETTISVIANQYVHDTWLAEHGQACENSHACCDGWPVSPAVYESIRRAVASLKRKGLVKIYPAERENTIDTT